MWSEKKSLKEFLLIYTSSTIFLLLLGVYFYYNGQKRAIIDNKLILIEKDIEKFIKNNQNKKHKLGFKDLNFLDLNISIYLNKRYKAGNFKEDLDLSKKYILKGTKLFLIKKEIKKRWGDMYFVSYRDIKNNLYKLKKEIAITLFIVSIFIVIIAYFLGKIIIKPAKKSLNTLEEFIKDATHEINTPISNILINIELIRELYPNVKNSEEFIKIENSAKRVSKIFKDLSFLKLQNIDNKSTEIVDLKKLIEDRLEFFNTIIKSKNIQIKKSLNNLKVDINYEDAVRLIDNLLSNAIKYSKDKEIEIILNNSTLIIKNIGKLKDPQKVLKKFEREDKSEGGFGLGLYIVKKICNRYKYKFDFFIKENKIVAKISLY